MNWLLIGIIALLAVFVIVGAVKGFSKTILGLASLALSLTIAWFVTPSVYALIQEKTTWETEAAQKIEDVLLKDATTEAEMDAFGEQLPLPQNIKDSISQVSAAETGLENKKNAVSMLITGWLLTVLIDLLLFIILEIILSLIGKLLSRLIKKTDLAGIDRLLGAILGFAEGALIVDAILLLIPFFSGTTLGTWFSDQIAASKLMTWIYNNNLVSYLAFTLFHINL